MKKLLFMLFISSFTAHSATFQFQFGAGFNDNTPVSTVGGNSGSTLGQQRQILFQAAADVWGGIIQSNVNIVIQADFTSLFCSNNSATLGSAGPTSNHTYNGSPFSNTFYPRSLVDALRGVNHNPGESDITARFNSNIDTGCFSGGTFYYGINGNSPANKTDLFSTVLHELGHGLGFLSLVDVGNGTPNSATGEFPFDIPSVFDRFVFDTEANMPWLNMNNAQRLASIENDPNLTWNGSNVNDNATSILNTGFNSMLVRLHAPSPIIAGSSVSHFSTAASPDLLMEPILEDLAFKQVDLTPFLFKDLGYTVLNGLIFSNGFE